MAEKRPPVTTPALPRRDSFGSERTPTFRELCAILQRCYHANPAQSITDLADVARTVIAKQRLAVDVAVFNRALDAVMKAHGGPAKMPGEFKRTIEAKATGVYRSRLEDRWAAILASAGLQPQYEERAFLDLAIQYVPDFYLPTRKVWLEIKPRLPDDEARTKAQLLAARTGEPVFILAGEPTRMGASLGFVSLRFNENGHAGEDLSWATDAVLSHLQPSKGVNWELVADTLASAGLMAPLETGTMRDRRQAAEQADREAEAQAEAELEQARGRDVTVIRESDESIPLYLRDDHAPVTDVRYQNESLPPYLWDLAMRQKS